MVLDLRLRIFGCRETADFFCVQRTVLSSHDKQGIGFGSLQHRLGLRHRTGHAGSSESVGEHAGRGQHGSRQDFGLSGASIERRNGVAIDTTLGIGSVIAVIAACSHAHRLGAEFKHGKARVSRADGRFIYLNAPFIAFGFWPRTRISPPISTI